METLHHVHVDDIAQAFVRAIANRSVALGESFHVASPAALTLRGYAEAVAEWFGQTPRLRFLPWEAWRRTVAEEHAAQTWDHIAHSPNASTRKAERLLDYRPRYRSLEAIFESLTWLMRENAIR
jgi:nucleoside-diphosphate-sugar epimerase